MSKYTVPAICQIPLEKMERGLARPVATLRLEPAEITSRLGLKFESAHDDLDELRAAAFRAPNGRQFALVRHQNQPNTGTDILINEKSRDLSTALLDALQVLRSEPRELQWTHPKINLTKIRGAISPPRLRLGAATLHRAAEIQEHIEILQSELDQVLHTAEAPASVTDKTSVARSQKTGARDRTRRATFSSEPLAPAVVRVLKSRGKPMGVSDILNGLLANGYKFNSPEPKKTLFARIYRLKGVRQVGRGKFAAK
jgi:hypothetical protein